MFDIWPVMNKCTVVAKRELFFAWPFGLAAWLCGLIFINRMQSDRARDQLCKASSYIKNKKIKLWIFPEGTRRNTGCIHPFKKGAFHVAIDAQLPILPVVFSSYRSFLDDNNKHLNSGRIIISTLSPIPTAGLSKIDLDNLMQRTYDAMNKEYQLITKEIQDDFKLTTNNTMKFENKSTGLTNTTTMTAPTVPVFASGTRSMSTATIRTISTGNSNMAHIRNDTHDDNNGNRHCLIDDDNVFNHQYTTFIESHNHRTTSPPTAN